MDQALTNHLSQNPESNAITQSDDTQNMNGSRIPAAQLSQAVTFLRSRLCNPTPLERLTDSITSLPSLPGGYQDDPPPLVDLYIDDTINLKKTDKFISPYTILNSTPSPRLNIPNPLSYPDPPDHLQQTIMASWKAAEPSIKTKEFVKKFLKSLSSIINARLAGRSEKRFEVDIFGSVSWGGETGQGGDLDLVIIDKELPQGCEFFSPYGITKFLPWWLQMGAKADEVVDHPDLWRKPPTSSQLQSGISTPASGRSARGRVAPNENLPRVYDIGRVAQTLRYSAFMDQVQPIHGASCPIVKFVEPEAGMSCDINVNDMGGWYVSCFLPYVFFRPEVLADY